jgi:CBS domain-containing protein
MADKGVVAALIGVGAGLLLAAAYYAASYAGLQPTPVSLTLVAAIAAFCASVTLLALVALPKPKKKKTEEIRLHDLPKDAYEHFPTEGPRPVIKPDTAAKDLSTVRESNTPKYADQNIFVTIKKGKGAFNPNVLKQIFIGLKGYANFIHILLVNEHDEYIGYLPAAYARLYMIGDNAETLIARYITDVLENPDLPNLRDINTTVPGDGFLVKKCIGLTRHECISDDRPVSEAMKMMTEKHVRGLVVYSGHRLRKPIGVLWDEDLVRLVLKREEKD